MTVTEHLEHPPSGWFVLDVMPKAEHSRDWVALMIDVPVEEFRSGRCLGRQCWVPVPGDHHSRDAAWDALEDMMATRH
jgi:hypothetical protein